MGYFPTTAWSLIDKAGSPGGANQLAATNRFISSYWRPVYYWLRAKGKSHHDAADLTQSFFAALLERNWIQSADPQRGRFRNFLLTVLKRFLSDRSPARLPNQAAFEQRIVNVASLVTEADRQFEPATEETPDKVFMRQWAGAVIATVMARLRGWCDEQGRPDWYLMFEATHWPQPGRKRIAQRKTAEHFSVTRDQVRYALEQTQEKFVLLMREELREQVSEDSELETEVAELQSLVG